MSFFDDLPPPPEPVAPGPQPPWQGPPLDELGASTGIRRAAHDQRFAFAVLDIVAYSTGFELQAVIKAREPNARLRHPGPQDPEALRFGIEFSDGRKVTTDQFGVAMRAVRAGETPAGPIMWSHGGGGGGDRWRQLFWVWPLPPPGRVLAAAVWKAAGMPELLVELEAQPILDAAALSERVW